MRKWLGIAAAVLVLDQLTKYWIRQTFALHEMVDVTPFFNLVFVYNNGAAFSLLANAAGWQRELFIAIALGASAWIAWLLRSHSADVLFCFALSLILGGALGNVIDRLTLGAVVDFLDFHAFGYHWPAFNLADSGISCGAVLLLWDALKPANKRTAKPGELRV
jgi:signal peptidase II